MSRFKQIGIDVDVHRAIEQKRRSFSESENDILRRILLPSNSVAAPRVSKGRAVPEPICATRSRGLWTVEILGERKSAANLKDAYRRLLLHLYARYPDFLQKFSRESAKSRRYVARSPEDLYFKSPHLAEHHGKELFDGWYFDTNLSAEQVSARARSAARLCGLHYGTDVRILNNLEEI